MIWLGAILTATSLPKSVLPDMSFRFADKVLHFFMYGVLGLLLARAMHNPPRTTRARVVFAAFFLICAIGAMDEWHQRYIQGRTMALPDWMADTSGGLIGALIWLAGSLMSSRNA